MKWKYGFLVALAMPCILSAMESAQTHDNDALCKQIIENLEDVKEYMLFREACYVPVVDTVEEKLQNFSDDHRCLNRGISQLEPLRECLAKDIRKGKRKNLTFQRDFDPESVIKRLDHSTKSMRSIVQKLQQQEDEDLVMEDWQELMVRSLLDTDK